MTHAWQAPHRAVAQCLHALLGEAGFASVLEPPHLLGGSQERPADVAALWVSDTCRSLAIDIRIARHQIHSALDSEARAPGSNIEAREVDKCTLYESRCRREGMVFVPFVLDEFGKAGASAQWLLHHLSRTVAERQRLDFRLGSDIATRAARIRRQWRAALTSALHFAIADGQRRRLAAAVGPQGGAADAFLLG